MGDIEKCNKMNILNYFDFRHKLPSEYQQAYQQGWSEQIKDYLKNKIKKSDKELSQIAKKIFIKEMKLGDKELQLYFKMIPEDRTIIFNLRRFKT